MKIFDLCSHIKFTKVANNFKIMCSGWNQYLRSFYLIKLIDQIRMLNIQCTIFKFVKNLNIDIYIIPGHDLIFYCAVTWFERSNFIHLDDYLLLFYNGFGYLPIYWTTSNMHCIIRNYYCTIDSLHQESD